MKRTIVQTVPTLLLVTSLWSCGNDDSYSDAIDKMGERHEQCLEEADGLSDLSVCQDMLDRETERIYRDITDE